MKTKYLLFIIAVLCIMFLSFLSTLQKPVVGTVTNIVLTEKKVTVWIQDSKLPLIVFTSIPIDITVGDTIEFYGTKNNYFGREQIIVDKIVKK